MSVLTDELMFLLGALLLLLDEDIILFYFFPYYYYYELSCFVALKHLVLMSLSMFGFHTQLSMFFISTTLVS